MNVTMTMTTIDGSYLIDFVQWYVMALSPGTTSFFSCLR